MKIVKRRLEDLRSTTIPIGFVAENLRTQVRIDCAEIFAEYPAAYPSLTVKPPEGTSYPVVVTRDGNDVVWDVSDSDLTHDGPGEIQLEFTSSGVIAKSEIGKIQIRRSNTASGSAPTPVQNWIAQATAILGEIPGDISDALRAAKESGEFDGFSPSVTVTDITGGHRITVTDANGTRQFDVPDGTPGQDGDSPTVSVTDITGGHRLTVTDKTGTQTTDILDGTPGADGVSPTVAIEEITGGHRITITDATGAHTADVMDGQNGAVTDVKIAGTSILDQSGAADIPVCASNRLGLLKPGSGLYTGGSTGTVVIQKASGNSLKNGTGDYEPVTPAIQHDSVFYGLAKAAGEDMKNSSNAVGVYTPEAQKKIQQMLGLWTPKFYSKTTMAEDGTDFGRYGMDFEDPTIEVWEELVIAIYQSDETKGQAIAANNWGTFYVRDAINNAYLANAGYIIGSAPMTIHVKRFPNVLMFETTSNANQQIVTRSFARADDYRDKIRYLWLHCEGGNVYAGVTFEAFIHRFI